MKRILEVKSTGNVTGPVSALIKSIGLPHPESQNKQPVILFDGEKEMACNLIGEHIHIPAEKTGDVVTMSWDDPKTGYLTVFPDGGRCLTLRDGVKFAFRAPKPGTMPSARGRVTALMEHYAFCLSLAIGEVGKVSGEIPHDACVSIATTLFLDSKGMVKIGCDKPFPEPAPFANKEPEVPNPDNVQPGVPPSEPDTPPWSPEEEVKEVALTDADHDRLLKLAYPDFCEKAAKAISYHGSDATKVAWQKLFIKVADSYRQSTKHPKVWNDIWDSIWQPASDEKKKAMDDAISEIVQKGPKLTDAQVNRIAAIHSAIL